MSSCQASSRLQVLANLPKEVERDGVSMNFPVFAERLLRSSQSVGLSQIETDVLICWGVLNIISLGISFISSGVE